MMLECEYCGGDVRVSHVYRASGQRRVARGQCMQCGFRYALVTFLLEAEERGTGAKALASRLREGVLRPKLEGPEQEKGPPG